MRRINTYILNCGLLQTKTPPGSSGGSPMSEVPDISSLSDEDLELAQSLSELTFKRIPKRQDLMWLVHKKEKLEELMKAFESKGYEYTTRIHRNTLAIALTLFEKLTGEDLQDEIELLHLSTRTRLKKHFRAKVVPCLYNLLSTCKEEMENFRPKDDDERFDMMIEDKRAHKKYQDELFNEMGVHNFNLRQHRKFTLVGELENENFFAEVKKRWEFEKPEKYFDYCGGVKEKPVLIDESGPVFLSIRFNLACHFVRVQ
jgi:hypothetical protein